LMDIALIGMKELRKNGELTDLDISDEINACSIVINVDVNGKSEEWLLMFKNETHNHPTEMEPFGGAATCLGGAIRDPLSGRSYVYQAMRITGSGDPRTRVEDTIQGKLPQRKITTVAAQGYSSYGNQIGLAAGQVEEVYDPGFIAKRMELGAVIAAAPKKNVKREKPQPGDVVILLGGRTGRDGCGGATGSSKEHTEESLLQSGAQVQKGNPSEERKIQRLFRKPDVSLMIKKCNDFGAGGVSVAIGELADGLKINLDTVPQKYEGLDGTELAISESQERMAVVISKDNVDAFIRASRKENLEATPVAQVTGDGKLVMCWRGKTIVDIKREFLDTNGASQTAKVKVVAPIEDNYYFGRIPTYSSHDLGNMWVENLQRLNVCSQKGLVEGFDSTAGAATVLMPLGGRYQMTPAEGMVAKIPVLEGDTKTGTLMTFGYNPLIGKWSPFHGAMFAVIESVAKIVALGGNYKKIRLTFQEYFERLGEDPKAWGKPFSALLGAYHAQAKLGIPAIGGKDSMSGTFEDMHVPPTLVSFAVACVDVDSVISSEFKKTSSKVILIPLEISEDGMPDFVQLRANYDVIHDAIAQGKILSSRTIRAGGVAGAVSKMSFGNMIGFKFAAHINKDELFLPKYGSILLEIGEKDDPKELFKNLKYSILGTTQDKQSIDINGTCLELNELSCRWQEPLEGVFPTGQGITTDGKAREYEYKARNSKGPSISNTKPRIFIPVSPEINGEYEVIKAFEKAGGQVDTLIFKNLSQEELNASFDEMEKKIDKCQIIAVPGGGNGTDLLSGSGQFLLAAFKYPRIKEAITKLLKQRDGLMLGISEGFKTLVRLGLVPYGEIKDFGRDDVALSLNTIGRHVSCMVSTKVTSVLSPWFSNVNVGDIHTIAVSHTEGRFTANREILDSLNKNGQIAAQYVNHDKRPTYDIRFNPNGSIDAIECLTSPDGRVMGKMGYPERIGNNIAKNIPGQKDQKIFEAGINYFR
ncbi:MAG: phosphoribosylformylglycinamidine synthase, partial [Clostridium sp.]|nr:phosphoribosylformylglycinamidine synthase [Clostridium sp.]